MENEMNINIINLTFENFLDEIKQNKFCEVNKDFLEYPRVFETTEEYYSGEIYYYGIR